MPTPKWLFRAPSFEVTRFAWKFWFCHQCQRGSVTLREGLT